MNQKIYFDNGSTSWPKAPQVASSMSELLESGAFNINRGNYEGAYELESLVLLTRMQLARLFHAPDSQTCHIHTGNHLFPELSDQRSPETRRSRTGQQPGT